MCNHSLADDPVALGPDNIDDHTAGKETCRRLFVYNGGFLRQSRLRRILSLAGYNIKLGLPRDGDLVGVWGQSPTAHRGEAIAQKRNAPILRVEDAFLRSLFPGRAGEPPLGLLLDHTGVHFDASTPSDLETLLASHPLDDTALLARARGCIERLKEAHLSKYSACDPSAAVPEPGYVLVIDQTRGDASVRASGGDHAKFREMLVFAQAENPGQRILIKSHPETRDGHRAGYYGPQDETGQVQLYHDAVSPWALLEGATAVYTLSSQFGFEAIFAGHKPRVFGQPFYAGWGLTQDEAPPPHRQRQLTRAQLFAAAMILYPHWYDPCRDQLCQLEQVIDQFEAETRAWREDHAGWTGSQIGLWKRRPMQKMFGRFRPMTFADSPAPKRRHMVWASKAEPQHQCALRLEDGFLRSRGLGAELVPPMSLVLDDLGIYYDPTRPSRLEQLVTKRSDLRPDQLLRVERLIRRIIDKGLSKYNIGGALPDLPDGRRILVAGQVEDDASILTGTRQVRSNLELLRRARAENPTAVILYKPHPDVQAGLRKGALPADCDLADMILPCTDPAFLLERVDEVWTMTSLIGFEALLRGIKVVTFGSPFYAGWGLTRDHGDIPARRGARPTMPGLVHATLIDYPRYFDPISNLPCPVEVVARRLEHGEIPYPGPANRALSKLQGWLAGHANIWR